MRKKPPQSQGIVLIEIVIVLPLLVCVFYEHLFWIKLEVDSLKEISAKRLVYDGKAVFQKTESGVMGK